MPNFEEHSRQFQHNRKLLSFFNSQGEAKSFSDWYLTIAFYSAVHLVEAILFRNDASLSWTLQVEPRSKIYFKYKHSDDAVDAKVCPSAHTFRVQILKQNWLIFGGLYGPFKSLYEKSVMARYNCYLDKPNDFALADTWLEAIKKEYTAIIKKIDQPPTPPKTKL